MTFVAALLLLTGSAEARPSAHLLEQRLSLRLEAHSEVRQVRLFPDLSLGGGGDDVGGDAGEWFVEGLAGFGAIVGFTVAISLVAFGLFFGAALGGGTDSEVALGILIILAAVLTAPLVSAWAINAVAESYGQPTSFARTALFGYGAWLVSALLSAAASASGSPAFASGIGLVTFFGFFAAQVYAANTYWPEEEDGGDAPRAATVRMTVARF